MRRECWAGKLACCALQFPEGGPDGTGQWQWILCGRLWKSHGGGKQRIGLNVDFSTDYNMVKWDDMDAYFGSAMEHGMIEQLQSTGLVAASTIKMLQLANTNHEAITIWPTAPIGLRCKPISPTTPLAI